MGTSPQHPLVPLAATPTPAPAAHGAPARALVPRSLLVRGLHLTLLWALAVAQPLFNLLGDNAVFFAARRATPWQVVAFALLVALAPPLLALALSALGQRVSRPAAQGLHLVVVGLLAALIAVQALKKAVDDPAAPVIAGAVILGALGAWLYARSGSLRSVMTWFSPLAVLVLVLFLFASPVHRIVLSGSTAAANVATARDIPVVMLVFDEFSATSLMDRRGHIDAARYPNFAKLVGDGTMYRNFTAPGDETTRMISTLLTGDRWRNDALPIAADYPHSLFTLLGRSYRMRVSEEASDLCPANLCKSGQVTGRGAGASVGGMLHDAGLVYLHVVAPRSVARKMTPVNETLGAFEDESGTQGSAEDENAAAPSASAAKKGKGNPNRVLRNLGGGGRPLRFQQWLKSIDGNAQRTLYFKHVLLPHVPWQYLPDGRWYRTHPAEYIPFLNAEPSFSDKWLIMQGYQRHLLQVGFVDTLLGRLIARLKETGLYDKALIVVTADNGESFLHLNHNRHVADPVTFTDVASTPLVIKRPFQRKGGYDDRHVRLDDVVPSIADVIGIRMPWRVTGRSLFSQRTQIPSDVTVTPIMGKGPPITISLSEYERRTRATLARKARFLAADGNGPGVYRIGPYPEVIGRPVAGLAAAPAGAVIARFNVPELLAKVDTRSNFIPINVTGRILGPVQQGQPLAIAINGTIAAVGKVAMLKGDPRHYFSFFVPPETLHDGANRAELFTVEPQDRGRFRFRSLGSTG